MLEVSQESIALYKQLAYKHLSDNNISLTVCPVVENEQHAYGICLKINGEETLYDIPASTGLSNYNTKHGATFILEHKILPNLGYLVHKQSLIDFHRYMT